MTLKKLTVLMLALALILSLTACSRKPAEPVPTQTTEPTDEPTTRATDTPLSTAFAVPCIDAPYDYEYLSDEKQIVIRRFDEAGILYLVADVQLTDVHQLQTALSSGKAFGELEPASAMAERSGAVLAINADDYALHKYGTIIRNGELLRTHDTTRNMLIVDANGDFTVRSDRANEDPAALGASLVAENVWQTFEFGPELIRDGEIVSFNPAFDVISTDPNRRDPRTAIGQIGPLHYVIIVADGRSESSRGMTLNELQQLMQSLGVQTAMNLDGGGSSEMWFQGEILNTPSQGEERRLSDILYF